MNIETQLLIWKHKSTWKRHYQLENIEISISQFDFELRNMKINFVNSFSPRNIIINLETVFCFQNN